MLASTAPCPSPKRGQETNALHLFHAARLVYHLAVRPACRNACFLLELNGFMATEFRKQIFVFVLRIAEHMFQVFYCLFSSRTNVCFNEKKGKLRKIKGGNND